MKIARVAQSSIPFWAIIDEDQVYELKGDRFIHPERGALLGPLTETELLAPIEPHNKIVGLLGNYGDKAGRQGPGTFLKPYSSIIAQNNTILWPKPAVSIGFEAELVVVIGRTAKEVPESNALDYIWGFTIGNDLTSFSVRKDDGPASTRYKTFDTFFPIGPWIVTNLDGDNLRLRSRLNGDLKQDTSTDQMAFGVAASIAWVSAAMTLNPGDAISLGTPRGYGNMQPGDIIECEVDHIGTLRSYLGQ